MRNKIIILVLLGVFVVSGIVLIATKSLKGLDVIGKNSIVSFEVVIKELSDNIDFHNELQSWSLLSPDDSAIFYWSKDFRENSIYDVMIGFPIEPFIDAGLDVNKLPETVVFDNMIIVGKDLGNEEITYDSEITPLESYKKIVDLKRKSIKYHAELDHYGIDLGNGNMFEWAKDMDTNDKDIVFVVDSKQFIEAGVNPKKVDGWAYAKVPTMESGKKIETYKFLRTFNIR